MLRVQTGLLQIHESPSRGCRDQKIFEGRKKKRIIMRPKSCWCVNFFVFTTCFCWTEVDLFEAGLGSNQRWFPNYICHRVPVSLHGLGLSPCVLTLVCFVTRYLSSCGILMTRVPPLLGAAMPGRPVLLPARSFFNLTDSLSKRKEYSERRIIG